MMRMPAITIKADFENYSYVDEPGAEDEGYSDTVTAELTLTHFNSPIASISLGAGKSTSVTTTTGCSVKAVSALASPTSASLTFDVGNLTIQASENTDGSVLLTKIATTTANTITFSNQCSYVVQFLFTPDDGATQTYMVPPGGQFPMSTAEQWVLSGEVKDHREMDSGGSTTAHNPLTAIAFTNGGASFTVSYANDAYVLKME